MQEQRSVPGSGRSPGTGYGNPLQYSCLESPMDRGTWRATVNGITKGWTQLKQLSVQACSVCIPFCYCHYLVAKSCPILWDPMDCSPPGSSVHRISKARIRGRVAISFSRSSWPMSPAWQVDSSPVRHLVSQWPSNPTQGHIPLRKSWFKKTHVPPGSLQHYLQ